MTIAKPKLRLTPYVWAKILAMRDYGDTEVGGWGFSGYEDRPLILTDFFLVKQECSSAFVELDDDANYKFFKEMAQEQKFPPSMFYRIWIHTHPGSSPTPSAYDNNFFDRLTESKDFDWAVMFIIARDGSTSARLKANNPILGTIETPMDVVIDWSLEFEKSEHKEWKKEYDNCVTKKTWTTAVSKKSTGKSKNKSKTARGFRGHLPSNNVPTMGGMDQEDFDDWMCYGGGYYGGGWGSAARSVANFDDGVSGFAPDDDEVIEEAEISEGLNDLFKPSIEDYLDLELIDENSPDLAKMNACWSFHDEIKKLPKVDKYNLLTAMGIKDMKEAKDYMFFYNEDGATRIVKSSVLMNYDWTETKALEKEHKEIMERQNKNANA